MTHACNCGGHDHAAGLGLGGKRTRFTAEQTVAEISGRPAALEALKTLGINHCCGAHLTLAEAAASAGVPLDTLLAALERAEGAPA